MDKPKTKQGWSIQPLTFWGGCFGFLVISSIGVTLLVPLLMRTGHMVPIPRHRYESQEK